MHVEINQWNTIESLATAQIIYVDMTQDKWKMDRLFNKWCYIWPMNKENKKNQILIHKIKIKEKEKCKRKLKVLQKYLEICMMMQGQKIIS